MTSSKEYHFADLAPLLDLLHAQTSLDHEEQNVKLADYCADLSESDEFEAVNQNTLNALHFLAGYFKSLIDNRKTVDLRRPDVA